VSTTTGQAPFRNEPALDFDDAQNAADLAAAIKRVREGLGRTYPLVIGDREVMHDETFASVNPASPGEVIGHHVRGTKADVNAAVAAAEAAFPAWAALQAAERADLLLDVAERVLARRQELSALMMLEVGKTRDEADGETAELADLLRWYASQMLELDGSRTLTPVDGEATAFFYVPLGVGAIIAPWNFPLALTGGMLSAALVAGNTVVVKPASASPTTVAWLADAFRRAGLPAGVLNLVTGPGGEIGDALVEHPRVRFVAFTGSMEVGVRIHEHAARVAPGQIWLKRVQLEMGGKNAIVVDETADLDAAAEAIVTSAFGYQGQKCSACSRAVLVGDVYDEVVSKVVERAQALRTGDPADPATDVGPLIDGAAQRKALDYIAVGEREGRVLLGGGEVPGEGYYVPPTIVGDVAPDARLAQEEVFGPVLAVIRARDFDQALQIANSTRFGLTGSLFTRDRERIARARSEFHVGNLYINRKSTGALMGVHPFGGFNMSGTDSKAGGPDYLLFFLQGKSVGERTGG
jgi:1-pyrroline-5-carboxylate dehydrogenase